MNAKQIKNELRITQIEKYFTKKIMKFDFEFEKKEGDSYYFNVDEFYTFCIKDICHNGSSLLLLGFMHLPIFKEDIKIIFEKVKELHQNSLKETKLELCV